MKKKFFSFLLVAAGLLCSGMASAVNVASVSIDGGAAVNVESLAEAFATVQAGETAVITLLADASLTGVAPSGSWLLVNEGRKITLDLNGNNATFSFYQVQIVNGSLKITGTGVLNYEGKYGTMGTQNAAYSNQYQFITLKGSVDPTASNYSVLEVGKNVTLNAFGFGAAISYVTDANSKYCSYGVVVDIYGYFNTVWGLSVNGNVQRVPGKDGVPMDANIPVFNVHAGATIVGGIYAAGYAKYYIAGTVQNGEDGYGIYAKAGELIIDGGKVISTSITYSEPQPSNDGCIGGDGCAIVIDAKNGYAGNVSLTVKGDAVVTGTGGYALYETSTDNSGTAVVNNGIKIESGTFTGNEEKGTINTSGEVQADVKINGGITGGTFSDNISDYLSDVNGIIVPVTNDEDETVFVVGAMPNGTSWEETPVVGGAFSGVDEDSYVKLTGAQNITVAAGETVEMEYLSLADNAIQKVTVLGTLKVGEIVMGEKAVITVENGGKLIVTGTNGIVAFTADNLVLESGAAFVLNPNVKANKSPYATVKFEAQTYAVDADNYKWDIIVSPFVAIDELFNDQAGKGYLFAYQYWTGTKWNRYANKQDLVDHATAFQPIALGNNTNKDTKTVYTFKGKLQGNISGKFDLERGYNFMGNGYVAPMAATEIISVLKAAGADVDESIYVWDFKTQNYVTYTEDNLDKMNDLNGMGFFILKANSNTQVNLNYEKLIWEKNVTIEL